MDILVLGISGAYDGPGDGATVSVGVLHVSGNEATVEIGPNTFKATTEIPLIPGERFEAVVVRRDDKIVLRKMESTQTRTGPATATEAEPDAAAGGDPGARRLAFRLAEILQKSSTLLRAAGRDATLEQGDRVAARDLAARLPQLVADPETPDRTAAALAELIRECLLAARPVEAGSEGRLGLPGLGKSMLWQITELEQALRSGGRSRTALSRSLAALRTGLLESAKLSLSGERADFTVDLPLLQAGPLASGSAGARVKAGNTPGAARLRIGQELPDRKTRGQRPWVFCLEVDFPEVGHVAARGTAAGESLSLRLIFSDASAADEASARIGELEESLRETGLGAVLVSCATSAAGTPRGTDLHEGGVDVIV